MYTKHNENLFTKRNPCTQYELGITPIAITKLINNMITTYLRSILF